MKKVNTSINLATLNFQIINDEKAEVKDELKKMKAQVAKNPRYINLCKNRMAQYQELLDNLNKEAKDTRRNIRKCRNRMEAAAI